MEPCDVAVIGGGILGAGIAYRLLERRPELRVVALEKEDEPARHQSGRNSGVLHAGLYYTPGSLKARLCGEGKRDLEAFARDHGILFAHLGKLVVATREDELPFLAELRARAEGNGVPVEELGPDGIRELEPNVRGIRALHSPTTGVIDFRRVTLALWDEVRARGGELRTARRVISLREEAAATIVGTGTDEVAARVVVNTAGLQSDRVAALGDAGRRRGFRIIPFRGRYLTLRSGPELVRGLVYPVPLPGLPFLGVHFTPRADGEVLIGPNALLAFGRESYGGGVRARDLRDTLLFPGFWRMALRHVGTGLGELRRELSRRALLAEVRRYVPDVRLDDLGPGPEGIRAQAVDRRGRLVDDFVIEEGPRAIHVVNAPSPGATASLAIGRHIAERVLDRLGEVGRSVT
jgi:(S)-2-hydroxyglutarate dehydrogenase